MIHYKLDWDVIRTPTLSQLTGSFGEETSTHPLRIEVGVHLLGDCQHEAYRRSSKASLLDDSASGG